MRFKSFEEFKNWFQEAIIVINNNKVLHDVVTNLDVFGPKKNIVDDVEFTIKGYKVDKERGIKWENRYA